MFVSCLCMRGSGPHPPLFARRGLITNRRVYCKLLDESGAERRLETTVELTSVCVCWPFFLQIAPALPPASIAASFGNRWR